MNHELATAIENGDVQSVRMLLNALPELVNSPNWTPPPLHCAVLWNQPQVAEVLLDAGANIEMLDPDRQTTPLRYAIMYAKEQLIPILLARGANSGPIVEDGTTAMQLALLAESGEFEEFDDLPVASEYSKIVDVLKQNGVR